MEESKREWLKEWVGAKVVVDTASPYVFLGTLHGQENGYLLLENADAHDLRDTHTTREIYVLESKRHGIRRNRKRVAVRVDEIVSVSRLDEVMED